MIFTITMWWLISSLIGWVASPIAWRLFHRLPDRGYGFARILGVLIAGYIFWIGVTFNVLGNHNGGALSAVFLLAALSLLSIRGSWDEFKSWLVDHRRTILVMELLFLIAFVTWAIVRAFNPEIVGTEKPMELAFINAILGSESFPPKDPWLSGYAISYYYLGYILVSFLTILSGVTAGEAFNLGIALWFAFVAVGSYAIIYNLLASRRGGRALYGVPLLGPLFVLITGNLGGLLEVLHARYLLWKTAPDGQLSSTFWTWLGLENLELPPVAEVSWIPTRHWWWWRASRVIRDRDLLGVPIGNQPIDEFPFFSFLLADNHPHVLAMPFVLLSIAFVLQVFLKGRRDGDYLGERRNLPSWTRTASLLLLLVVLTLTAISTGQSASQEGLAFSAAFLSLIKNLVIVSAALALLAIVLAVFLGVLPASLTRRELVFSAFLFGGLAFLNTWDFPIYLSLLFLVLAWSSRWLPFKTALKNVLQTSVVVAVLGFVFYLPWYPSFSSQAGGILPHLMLPTRFVHFLVMFLVLLLPICVWLIHRLRNGWGKGELRKLVLIGLGLPFGLLIFSWLLAIVVGWSQYRLDPVLFEGLMGALGVADLNSGIGALIVGRLTQSWTALFLGFMSAAAVLLLLRKIPPTSDERGGPQPFVIFMVVIGALLIIAPEFVYLKDQFMLRMNTIFKFYFAAWILWGLSAAYTLYEIWENRGRAWVFVKILVIFPLLLGLVYPIFSTWTKTSGFQPPFTPTLDGTDHLAKHYPGDYEAIQWITENLEEGVITEAVGGSYTYYGRISVHTPLSTVLGWPGHESQWRGGAQEQGSREQDIRVIYMTNDWVLTKDLLDKYDINYVLIGDLERSLYNPIFEAKFETFAELIYENEQVRIYRTGSDA